MLEDSITQKEDPTLVKHEHHTYIHSDAIFDTIASSQEWVCENLETIKSLVSYGEKRELTLRVAESDRFYSFKFSDKTLTASVFVTDIDYEQDIIKKKEKVPQSDINNMNHLFNEIEAHSDKLDAEHRQQVMSAGAVDGAKKTIWWSIGFFLFAFFATKHLTAHRFMSAWSSL